MFENMKFMPIITIQAILSANPDETISIPCYAGYLVVR